MTNKEEKVVLLKWVCPDCPKVISSIYKRQFEYNKMSHIFSHSVKKDNQE